MLSQSVRQRFGSHSSFCCLALACLVGLLLGGASLLLSPLWVLIALVGGGLVVTTLKRPEIGLLGFLALTSSIIDEASNPAISIGFGTLYMTDVILFSLLGLIVLRWLVEPDFEFVRTPLDLPLMAFYGVALLSTFIAILKSSVSFSQSLGEVRTITNYLVFFAVTNLVREERQLRFLLKGLFLLATVVAAAMVVQFLLGGSVAILPGRVETLRTEGQAYGEVTRMIPPGISMIMPVFITSTVILVLGKFRLSNILKDYLQWGLLGLALLLTFFRSYWVSTSFALLLLAYLVKGQNRHRLVRLVLVVMLLVLIIVLSAWGNPDSRVTKLASASIARLASLGNSKTFLDPRSSLRWRDFEYRYALPHLISRPLIGLGLGVRYRPLLPGYDHEQYDGRDFIHNGHLWILMKTGLLGYLCLMWLSVKFLRQGLNFWRYHIPSSEMTACVLGGFTLTYLGVLVIAIVEPTLMYWYWTPMIGMMMGVNEIIMELFDVSDTDIL